jgi:hypothetical protein
MDRQFGEKRVHGLSPDRDHGLALGFLIGLGNQPRPVDVQGRSAFQDPFPQHFNAWIHVMTSPCSGYFLFLFTIPPAHNQADLLKCIAPSLSLWLFPPSEVSVTVGAARA